MRLCVGYTGGAGAYQTVIYRLSDNGVDKIFSNPEWEEDTFFDTGFALRLSEGFTCTVENIYTDFQTPIFIVLCPWIWTATGSAKS